MCSPARLAALALALVATAAAASPPTPQDRLAAALARYAAADWAPIPDGPLVRPGEADASQVPALRARLAAEGALGGAARTGDTLDPALADALRRAQDRLGLAPDGVIGPKTRAALNVPAAVRTGQIRAALAALDTLGLPAAGRWILVNVPEYRVRAFQGTREMLRMRAVVGADREGWRTPLFADAVEYLEVRPVWNVPTSIARAELAPRGAAALAAEGFELVRHFGPDAAPVALTDSTLARMRDGHLLLRQRAGPQNPLGRLKIMFPNAHNVYLHDTPATSFFARDDRRISHGCVRLERPAELGAWVAGMPEAALAEQMDAGPSARIDLDERVPVVLAALPAWPGDDGAVWFADGGYGP